MLADVLTHEIKQITHFFEQLGCTTEQYYKQLGAEHSRKNRQDLGC